MTLIQRLTAPGPKRILALDGGGIRGIVTLEYLARIEKMLRERYRKPDLVLADYFDLIGGTSTGSVIAAALAIGFSTEEIRNYYMQLGARIFKPRSWWYPNEMRRRLSRRYDSTPLEEELTKIFGGRTLGDESIRTGLCIVTKRCDTNSTWPFFNNPRGQFFEYHKDTPLLDLIRASTAAPTYFFPKAVDVGSGQTGAFIDGAVSPCNNPALLLLLIATLDGYRFQWPTGENNLLLVSVGTGFWNTRLSVKQILKQFQFMWGIHIPALLFEDFSWHNQLLLQCLSKPLNPWQIDLETGVGHLLTAQPLLSYVRYDVAIEAKTIEDAGLQQLLPVLPKLRRLDSADVREELALLAGKVADKDVKPEHFPQVFTPPSW